MRVFADVELDVVVRAVDPIHRFGRHEDRSFAGAHDESVQIGLGRLLPLLEQIEQALLHTRRRARPQLLFGARERVLKTAVVERFQQVVERVHLEGPQGVLDRTPSTKTITGTAPVPICSIRSNPLTSGIWTSRNMMSGEVDRTTSAASAPLHDPTTITSTVAFEAEPQRLARDRLVIHDQHPNHAAETSNGITSRAATPPGAVTTLNSWRSP